MRHDRAFRRRPLSLTSLIDVIFLLLLFFMLSSTFSKFAEVELAAAGAGAAADTAQAQPVFIRLGAEGLRVNTRDVTLDALPEALADLTRDGAPTPTLVTTSDGVSAQRLTDLLVALQRVGGLEIRVLKPT